MHGTVCTICTVSSLSIYRLKLRSAHRSVTCRSISCCCRRRCCALRATDTSWLVAAAASSRSGLCSGAGWCAGRRVGAEHATTWSVWGRARHYIHGRGWLRCYTQVVPAERGYAGSSSASPALPPPALHPLQRPPRPHLLDAAIHVQQHALRQALVHGADQRQALLQAHAAVCHAAGVQAERAPNPEQAADGATFVSRDAAPRPIKATCKSGSSTYLCSMTMPPLLLKTA